MKKSDGKRAVAAASAARRLRTPKVVDAQSASAEQYDEADRAKRIAVEYCLFHYPTLYTGGIPRRSSDANAKHWVVPIVLGSPTYGVMGEVGELRIDVHTRKVIASTDCSKVVAAGEQLYKGKK